jgi:phage/plasmid-associated DNA primase
MPFLKRRPWVLHEAFDQRKWHFSSDVKTVITGEPININVKNGPVLSQRVTAPIFWGTNHPPQLKESSNAITNRLVVIECRWEFKPDNRVGAAKEAFRLGLGKPSNLVLKQCR